MDINEIRKKISDDDGILVANDVVFFSGGTLHDFTLVQDKFLEFYSEIPITQTAYQNVATVIIIDYDYMKGDFVYESELNYAVSHKQRIITYKKFTEALHSKLVIIDQGMYKNLSGMIKSKDKDSMILACEIISNANRTDPVSIKNILKLTVRFQASLIGGITKKDLFKLSPHTFELFNYLESEHYEDFQLYTYDDD